MSVEPEKQRAEFLERAVEATIRVGLVVVLIAWCFQTLRPFLQPALWGMIIAIAAYPGYVRLRRAFGGRRGAAATAFALLGLVIIVIPMAVLAGTLADGVGAVADHLKDGALTIPAPPEAVKAWPLVGERVHALWLTASHNIGDVLAGFGPQLRSAGGAVVSAAAGAGLALLEFVAAIIIAAVLMVYADGGERAADAIAVRIAGPRGPEYADLAKLTIRNVTRGILGVALIQALLAGIGFLAIGLPAAGLLALVCLILATIQVGVGPIMIPATIYVFYVNDTLTAVLFAGWTVLVILSDNVLKPILLGRGARVPMLVIFLGAIGGFLASGIIGLFTGAVVLSLGYTLFVAWLNRTPAIEPETPVR